MKPEQILKQFFGHAQFRGCQQAVIERVMAGGHTLVIMPTGAGKSVCYQVPALVEGDGLTLVISPLIALMKDQVDGLQDRGIDATFINSSLKRQAREKRQRQLLEGRYRLLYVTPERFRKEAFLDVIAKRSVDLLAVDEAHCISTWGHDFRPDYTRLTEIRGKLGNPTTIALTATATPDVQVDIVRQLGLDASDVQMFHEGIDRPNLALEVEKVWGDDDKIEQIQRICTESDGGGIVYFALIKTLERLSDRLNDIGLYHEVYHGKLDMKPRRRIQERFMAQSNTLVLATNAFGMGIDKADIRFVTHAEIPGSMESYYQEIGRAGRDGKPSVCTLLYDENDLLIQMEFLRWSNPDADYYRRVFELLQHEAERVDAFGIDWIKETLHARQAKHDHRLETALAMLERHGAIEGTIRPELSVQVVGPLPPRLADQTWLDQKLKRDQTKLHALVQYINHDGDRKESIHDYFGLPYTPDSA
jgi:ATP-dependent DNA helicase RecQ